MNRKPSSTLSAVDVQDIMSRAYANVRDLCEMGVQVGFIANGVAATIELSAYRKDSGLKTLSVIFFPADKEKKINFINRVISDLRHGDAYEVISLAAKSYNKEFIF